MAETSSKPKTLAQYLSTELDVTDRFPLRFRVIDAILWWLTPIEIVFLSHALKEFDDLIRDDTTVFRYMLFQDGMKHFLNDPNWRPMSVIPTNFLTGWSPISFCQSQATQFAIDQRELIKSIPQHPDTVLNTYDKIVPILWQMVETAKSHWKETAFYSVMSFALESLDHSCLLDSAELARVIAAFNKTTQHKGLHCSMAGVSEHVNDRLQHLSFPASIVGSFIIVQDDSSFLVMLMVLETIIRCVSTAAATTRWFFKDMIHQAQEQFPLLLSAQEVPMVIYELTRLALESGTQNAFMHMITLWIEHKEAIDLFVSGQLTFEGLDGIEFQATGQEIDDVEPIVFEDFLLRSSFAPATISKITTFMLDQGLVTVQGLIAKILVPTRQTDIYVLQQGSLARLKCIEAIVNRYPRKKLGNFLWNETVVPEAWHTLPTWARAVAHMWTHTPEVHIDHTNILQLANKLGVGLVVQLAIVVVDICDDRDAIIEAEQPLIHHLFWKAVEQASRKTPQQDVWKEIVLRIGLWIPDKLAEYIGPGFRPKTLVKGKNKKRGKLVLKPTPLSVLLYQGLYDLIEPFCANVPAQTSIDYAMIVLLSQKKQYATIPLLCRALGIQYLPNTSLVQICDSAPLYECVAIVSSLCQSPKSLLCKSVSKRMHMARTAAIQVMRKRGASTRDIVYELLEATNYADTKYVLDIVTEETPIDPVMFSEFIKTSNMDQARVMMTAYPPVLLMSMDQDVWESMPRVWSTHERANDAYAKPPPNGLAAAIRYRREEFVQFLIQEFPDMVRICISKFPETVSEASWLSMETIEHCLQELTTDQD